MLFRSDMLRHIARVTSLTEKLSLLSKKALMIIIQEIIEGKITVTGIREITDIIRIIDMNHLIVIIIIMMVMLVRTKNNLMGVGHLMIHPQNIFQEECDVRQ